MITVTAYEWGGRPYTIELSGPAEKDPAAYIEKWLQPKVPHGLRMATEAEQAEFDRRLQSDGSPALFLPFVGEFGHRVMYHMRLVHWHRAERKIVCCRPSERAFYPSATEFEHDWIDPIPDSEKAGTMRDQYPEWPHLLKRHPLTTAISGGNLSGREERFLMLRLGERVPFAPVERGLICDVLLGIRHREFWPVKNWPHWARLAEQIHAAGLTIGVVGAKPYSLDVPYQLFHTGDYDADASIEAIQKCRLYVGTDTGVSHLAATVGPGATPMLVFYPQDVGAHDFTHRMSITNPTLRRVWNGWDDPQAVMDAITRTLKGNTNANPHSNG